MGYIDPGLVSIILPTMWRPGHAERVVRQVHETTDRRLEIVVVVDDDPETARRVTGILMDYGTPFKLVYHPEPQGHARSWNRGLRCADGGVIVFFADDLIPEQGWLDEALRVLDEELNGYGLVGFNDTRRSGRNESTHYLVSRQFVLDRLNGCIAFEDYEVCCNDSEACRRARQAGHYRHAQAAIVKRLKINDETKRSHHDGAAARRDLRRLAKRGRQHFPDDFEPAIVR